MGFISVIDFGSAIERPDAFFIDSCVDFCNVLSGVTK